MVFTSVSLNLTHFLEANIIMPNDTPGKLKAWRLWMGTRAKRLLLIGKGPRRFDPVSMQNIAC